MGDVASNWDGEASNWDGEASNWDGEASDWDGEASNWDGDWSISFAGCGFRSVYYLGAVSCLLDRAPQLVHGASRICGASSGCLVAAALTVGVPLDRFCADLLSVAGEARKHALGVFHPTFSLLRAARRSLLEQLPPDAHLKASGRLCVSLTRLSDGANVLVSQFDSRDELIQVLMCSCFFPVYCGFLPPSYRGQLYMDGALSNNVPLSERRNTIIVAPFCGESDICPAEGSFSFLEVNYGNMSLQVNARNVHRICTSFLPPPLETLAEICHDGYMDALRFLRERGVCVAGVCAAPCPPAGLGAETEADKHAGCEKAEEEAQLEGGRPQEEEEELQHLPAGLRRVLCEACRQSAADSQCLPVKVFLSLLLVLLLPVQLSFSLLRSVVSWVLTSAADLCRTRSSRDEESSSAFPEQLCSSSSIILQRSHNGNQDLFSCTPASTGRPGAATLAAPACGKAALNRRRNTTLCSTGQEKL